MFPCLPLFVQRGQYPLFYTDYTEFRMKSALIDIFFKGNHFVISLKKHLSDMSQTTSVG